MGSGIGDLDHGRPVGHIGVVGLLQGLAEFGVGDQNYAAFNGPLMQAVANVGAVEDIIDGKNGRHETFRDGLQVAGIGSRRAVGANFYRQA